MSLRVTDIEYRSTTGQPVKIIPADKPVVILLSISNDAPFDQSFTTIVQVLDSTGVAVFLSFQTASLPGHDSNEYGFSWVPDTKGTYTIRVFTVTSLENPTILSHDSSLQTIVV
jgi:hypothetical protein